jgi:serine/threonine-protein kinase
MVTGQRPFNGRSMPELTQAIIHGNPQPPSAHNPTLSHGLERIILKALSLHREQRYPDASLMAQELRKLNLQPTSRSEAHNLSGNGLSPNGRMAGQNRPNMNMHPPKRPQVQRPKYLDVDLEQTLPPPAEPMTLPPPAEPMTPPIQHLFHEHRPHAPGKKNNQLPSMEPANYQHMSPSPHTPLPEDVKTVSLESLERPQGRRSFWSQLQKLFKLSQ